MLFNFFLFPFHLILGSHEKIYLRICLVYMLKRNKIVTYCSGGYRGNIAADELNKQGFDAVTIEGGYSAWKDEEKKKENSRSNSK